MRLILEASDTNVIYEPFPGLVLHRLSKTSFTVRPSVFMQYNIFHKSNFIFENCLFTSRNIAFPGRFIHR